MNNELHTSYRQYFKSVAMISGGDSFLLSSGNKIRQELAYEQSGVSSYVFFLKHLSGSLFGLEDPSSILISQSAATGLFGNEEPINKTIKLDNKENFTVKGVYDDISENSDMHLDILLPWSSFVQLHEKCECE